jgi:hypothetical protein
MIAWLSRTTSVTSPARWPSWRRRAHRAVAGWFFRRSGFLRRRSALDERVELGRVEVAEVVPEVVAEHGVDVQRLEEGESEADECEGG